jgi:hypothetical protein
VKLYELDVFVYGNVKAGREEQYILFAIRDYEKSLRKRGLKLLHGPWATLSQNSKTKAIDIYVRSAVRPIKTNGKRPSKQRKHTSRTTA